jgi:hypothetical protein
MASLKHVGRIVNLNRRCVVVFREIYDERGHVKDKDHCLVFDTESLPNAEHQDLMRIIEGEPAQSTGDLYNVLQRERMGNGMTALTWLASSNRLRKVKVENVELTPDSQSRVGLKTLNKIVEMQKSGASQEQIENVLRDDTDNPPREMAKETVTDADTAPLVEQTTADTQTGDGVLDDAAIAKSYMDQAKLFEKQAADLKAEAEKLDPSLAPKKKRGRPKNEPAS